MASTTRAYVTGQCSTDGCGRGVMGRGLCPTHYSAWHRTQRKYHVTCAECGETAPAARAGQKYCSTQCANQYNARLAGAATRKPRELELYTGPTRQTRPVAHIKTASRITSGRCRVCNEWFVSSRMDVTCSDQCRNQYRADQRRIDKDRRRSLQREAYREDVHRAKVYAADGYRCHLCGKKTDPAKVVPHPKAPTIDHVIPLAAGGTHEPANCRTACFQCNATKGHRGGGEQLLLVII